MRGTWARVDEASQGTSPLAGKVRAVLAGAAALRAALASGEEVAPVLARLLVEETERRDRERVATEAREARRAVIKERHAREREAARQRREEEAAKRAREEEAAAQEAREREAFLESLRSFWDLTRDLAAGQREAMRAEWLTGKGRDEEGRPAPKKVSRILFRREVTDLPFSYF